MTDASALPTILERILSRKAQEVAERSRAVSEQELLRLAAEQDAPAASSPRWIVPSAPATRR